MDIQELRRLQEEITRFKAGNLQRHAPGLHREPLASTELSPATMHTIFSLLNEIGRLEKRIEEIERRLNIGAAHPPYPFKESREPAGPLVSVGSKCITNRSGGAGNGPPTT